MADNLETISNFSIQDTMERGMGNQELLNDLFSPETSTSNPEDVTPIINTATPDSEPAKPNLPRGKDIVPPKSVNGKTDEEKQNGESMISDFLFDNEEEEDEEQEKVVSKTPVKTSNIKKENSEEGDQDQEEPSTQFTALSNDLFKLGVFTNEDEDEEESISTAEQFLERFNTEKKKGASEIVQNFIGQFGEDYQDAFDAIFVKGINPKEYFNTYNSVAEFSGMDLTFEDNQVRIMKQALTEQEFDAEDVETEIERLRNYGDLENVAIKHHKVLVKKEAAKLKQMEFNAEEAQKQKSAIRNQYINNVQTIIGDKVRAKDFDGIPINPKIATELQDFLLVDKWKTPSGETLTDFDRAILDMKKPENHEMKVKVGLLLKMLEKDPTLSTIQKTGVTKKSNQLFGEIARHVTKDKKSFSQGGSGAKPNSWFL